MNLPIRGENKEGMGGEGGLYSYYTAFGLCISPYPHFSSAKYALVQNCKMEVLGIEKLA